MSMMLYLHASCYLGVVKVGETGDPMRGRGHSSSTFYSDVLSYCLRISPELLNAREPQAAEQRVKLYERLLLRYLKRFLLDDRREAREHTPTTHAQARARTRA
jgi:hypothetical protein